LWFVAIVSCRPLLIFLRDFLREDLFDPNSKFQWDTVSYHLPGFIEFYQKGTLWSVDGPYQSYSFGYELIGNYFAYLFQQPFGLRLAHLFSVILLILTLRALQEKLSEAVGISTGLAPFTVLACGVWGWIFRSELGEAGKNDIFMTTCILAALVFFLDLISGIAKSRTKTGFAVLLISLSLGLAFSVKPHALAYLALCGLVAVLFWIGGSGRERLPFSWGCVALGFSVALGGFWLVRNLIMLGTVSPISAPWKTTLLWNLGGLALDEFTFSNVLLLLSLSTLLPFTIAYRRAKTQQGKRVLVSLLVFQGFSLLVFSVTPHSFSPGGLKYRLGMPMVVSALLLYSVMAQLAFSKLKECFRPVGVPKGRLRLGAFPGAAFRRIPLKTTALVWCRRGGLGPSVIVGGHPKAGTEWLRTF